MAMPVRRSFELDFTFLWLIVIGQQSTDGVGGKNSKHEYRNPKQKQNDSMFESLKHLDIQIFFEFHASNFEFSQEFGLLTND